MTKTTKPPLAARLHTVERALERAARRRGELVTVRLQRPGAGLDDPAGAAEGERGLAAPDQGGAGGHVAAPGDDDHGVQ